MTKEQILKEIHMIAGYYESTDAEIIDVKDNITGSILDLIDPPYRDTECGVSSGYTS
jgi:TolB-like protein